MRLSYAKRYRPGLRISGKTEDGKLVVQGMFPIVSSTIGLPLEMLLPDLEKNNMVIDWVDFYQEALRSGWTEKTTIIKIETAVGDYFGTEYKQEVVKRLYDSIKRYNLV